MATGTPRQEPDAAVGLLTASPAFVSIIVFRGHPACPRGRSPSIETYEPPRGSAEILRFFQPRRVRPQAIPDGSLRTISRRRSVSFRGSPSRPTLGPLGGPRLVRLEVLGGQVLAGQQAVEFFLEPL